MTLTIDVGQVDGVMSSCTIAFGSGMEKFDAVTLQQIGRDITHHILHVYGCFYELVGALLKWMLAIS
jgi:hypothetical protein